MKPDIISDYFQNRFFHFISNRLRSIPQFEHWVLVGTNMKVTNESDIEAGPKDPTYTEQVMWRDAATGKLLAASDYFSPMSEGSQPLPGYGGLTYHVLQDGHLMALKVLPQTNPTSTAATTSTTTTAGQNSTEAAS